MNKPLVIKIGGAILESPKALTEFFSAINQVKQPLVIVHGGGCIVDQQLAQAGFTTEKYQGLRISPFEQMPIIAGALAGFVNKTLVAKAQQQNLNAVGITLADGKLTQCLQLNPQLQAVGKVVAHSSSLLDGLLNQQMLPIVASIGALSDGSLVNVNADDAAVVIAELLNAELVLLSDVNGVKNAQGDYLTELDLTTAEQLIEQGVIAGGMVAKVRAALNAASQLRRSIAVASWSKPEQITQLLEGAAIGTRILA